MSPLKNISAPGQIKTSAVRQPVDPSITRRSQLPGFRRALIAIISMAGGLIVSDALADGFAKTNAEIAPSTIAGNCASCIPVTPPVMEPVPAPAPSWLLSKNIPLAGGPGGSPIGGLDGYQGFPLVAVNPVNPKWIVAAAISEGTPSFSTVNVDCFAGFTHSLSTQVTGSATLFGSTDGGLTWKNTCPPWVASSSDGPPGADQWSQSDPAVTWDDQNIAYAVYTQRALSSANTYSGESLVIARSLNGGVTWGNAKVVADKLGSPYSYYRQNRIAVDTSFNGAYSHYGRKYIISAIHLTSQVRSIQVNYSDDMITWHPVNLAPGPAFVGAAPNVTIAADGTVYAVWTAVKYAFPDCDFNDPTLISSSHDGGVTWSVPTLIDQHFYHTGVDPIDGVAPSPDMCWSDFDPPAQELRRANNYSVVDIDKNPKSPYYGTLYLVSSDYPKTPVSPMQMADIDVYLRRSIDNGVTWSDRVRVNDDVPQQYPATQFLPTLSVDQSDGSVNIAWLDTRNETAPVFFNLGNESGPPMVISTRTQVFFARSTNGGLSFSKNRNMTDAGLLFHDPASSLDEFITHTGNDGTWGGRYQYGDWLGISAANRKVHIMWTDSRNMLWTQEDIATASASICSLPTWTPTGLAASNIAGGIALSWKPVSVWGIGADNGTYTVERLDGHSTVWKKLVSALPQTAYIDNSAPSGLHYYRVTATNNCDGTALTAMSTISPIVSISSP